MKRLFVMSGALLLLAGCAQANTAWEINISPSGETHRSELIQTARSVVERRFEQQKQKLSSVSLTETTSGATLRFAAKDTTIAQNVLKAIQGPLAFSIMVESPKEGADIYNETFGGFKQIGITEQQIAWASSTEASGGGGSVVITLTKEGQETLRKLYSSNLDKEIGIFVRGRLMSRKRITANDATTTALQIDGIPSLSVANVFADDVNVGTHVSFQSLADIGVSVSSSLSSSSLAPDPKS